MIKYKIPCIGQGGCIEQQAYLDLKRHRILYDCGTSRTDIKTLKRFIDTIDTDIPTTFVISHLHYDHISGIPYLINHFKKHGKKIKRLFLRYKDFSFEVKGLLMSPMGARIKINTPASRIKIDMVRILK